MDAAALSALIDAYRLHPDDSVLGVILREAPEAEEEIRTAVLSVLQATDLSKISDPELQCRAGALALAWDEVAAAEKFAGAGESPCHFLLRSRISMRNGNHEDARRAYDRALAANPALQDIELEKAFSDSGEGEPARATNVISLSGHLERMQSGGGHREDHDPLQIGHLEAGPDAKITFADVGGLEEIKSQINRRIILPFLKPSLYQRFKRRAGGGVLLYGPPGCGKTLLARATAGECDAHFINVAISDVLDMYIGESEKRLTAVFEEARQHTPAVLFFDELEALAARRRFGTNDASASLVSTFLSELDGFQANNEGVLILAATNVPWAVDSAFRRPGRFDRLHFVPPPDQIARMEILSLLLKDLPGADTLDVARLASRTGGYSGADLRNLVETATDIAIERSLSGGKEQPLDASMFDAAIKEVKPTTVEWLTTARNYARYSNSSGQYDDVLAFLDKHGK